MYNLDGILTDESLTKEKWPGILCAVVHMMPDSMVDGLHNVADTKSMKAAYFTVHDEHGSYEEEHSKPKESKHNEDASAGSSQ
eukprot:9030934-Karenia_brevis.AAC.1